jgi:ketosteroid isomerase-like protein
MSVAQNKDIATKFVTTMREHSGFDEALVSDDLTWRTASGAVMDKPTLKSLLGNVKKRMPEFPEMIVTGVTAEGDRVAVEAEGKCALPNGKRYDNTYHFLLRIRDGRIFEVREYADTLLVVRTFGSMSTA